MTAMTLATSNSQGELSPLEVGMHALHFVEKGKGGAGNKGGTSEYARAVGRNERAVRMYRDAARVAENVGNVSGVLLDKAAHLAEISKIPESCWTAAVNAMRGALVSASARVSRAALKLKCGNRTSKGADSYLSQSREI